MSVPAPGIDFTKSTPCNDVSETTFNRVNSLTRFLEAANDFWNVVRVNVTQAKLPILIIFAQCVNMTLFTDEEAKVIAARNTLDLYRVAERHLNRITHFLPLHCEGPGK